MTNVDARPIALVGLMGAGKSVVARALGERLGGAVADLDAMVEAERGCSVAELFEREGEPAFRRLEGRILEQALAAGAGVIACGGGIVLDPAHRGALAARCRVVWLEVSPPPRRGASRAPGARGRCSRPARRESPSLRSSGSEIAGRAPAPLRAGGAGARLGRGPHGGRGGGRGAPRCWGGGRDEGSRADPCVGAAAVALGLVAACAPRPTTVAPVTGGARVERYLSQLSRREQRATMVEGVATVWPRAFALCDTLPAPPAARPPGGGRPGLAGRLPAARRLGLRHGPRSRPGGRLDHGLCARATLGRGARRSERLARPGTAGAARGAPRERRVATAAAGVGGRDPGGRAARPALERGGGLRRPGGRRGRHAGLGAPVAGGAARGGRSLRALGERGRRGLAGPAPGAGRWGARSISPAVSTA